MRSILDKEQQCETYLSSAVGAYSALIGAGATRTEASNKASEIAKEHWAKDGAIDEKSCHTLPRLGGRRRRGGLCLQ